MSNEEAKFHVLVLGNIRPEGLDVLKEFSRTKILPEPVDKSQVLECIAEMDAILHKVGKIDAEIIDRQTNVKIIARHGVGLDDLDLPTIEAAGIPVSTTLTANTNAVAEATIGLVLSLLRHLNIGEDMLKRHKKWTREDLMGREIKNATVGIVGYGRIGQLVAKYYSAFDANIIVHDAIASALADCPFVSVGLDELLERSDIVSLHCPLITETHHLIDAKRLALMKKTAILVNTSRGGLVDQVALAKAAKAGTIAGAAIDVFDVDDRIVHQFSDRHRQSAERHGVD